MFIFEVMISLLLVGAVLSLWAERVGVPYPRRCWPSPAPALR